MASVHASGVPRCIDGSQWTIDDHNLAEGQPVLLRGYHTSMVKRCDLAVIFRARTVL